MFQVFEKNCEPSVKVLPGKAMKIFYSIFSDALKRIYEVRLGITSNSATNEHGTPANSFQGTGIITIFAM